MQRILFTGPRKLTDQQRQQVVEIITTQYLPESRGEVCSWVLGDAPGVDELLWEMARYKNCHYSRIMVNPKLSTDPETRKWAYAERSQRMVKLLSPGDIAVGFPNKSCPNECTPQSPWSGGGSGTWGTLAASAAVEGVEVYAYPIVDDVVLPNWLRYKQLSLF
ncbi:MAG: hypothetical protein WBA93_32550 [Microcoleaceae cyanobacterium]